MRLPEKLLMESDISSRNDKLYNKGGKFPDSVFTDNPNCLNLVGRATQARTSPSRLLYDKYNSYKEVIFLIKPEKNPVILLFLRYNFISFVNHPTP